MHWATLITVSLVALSSVQDAQPWPKIMPVPRVFTFPAGRSAEVDLDFRRWWSAGVPLAMSNV